MVTIDENEVLPKLYELIEIEVEELLQYSANSFGGMAKEGEEENYEKYKKRVQLIMKIKEYIFFSVVFPIQNA